MEIHKILVPVDASPITQNAIMQALKIAKKYKGAKITLLHVVNEPSSLSTPALPACIEKAKKTLISQGETLLEKHFVSLSHRYKNIEMALISGFVPDAIAQYAENTKQDLIIMGRRNLSILQKLFTSHVSDKVAATTRIPVLKIHEKSNLVTFPVSCKTS